MLRLTDLIVVVWAAVFVVIGVDVAKEVRDVGRIGATVVRVGDAVERTGSSLEQLGDLPVLGDRIADAGGPIREAGAQARRSAEMSRDSARDLSVLLGVSIAVVPSLPLLLLYVPRRVAAQRDRRAVARALRDDDGAELQELLARRALVHLPLHALHAASRHPVADLSNRRYAPMASAELRRLGLRAPRTWPADRAPR